jgi:hypothetical protein
MSQLRPRVMAGLVVVWSISCGDDPPQANPDDDSSSGDSSVSFTTADPPSSSDSASTDGTTDTTDATGTTGSGSLDDTAGPDPSSSTGEGEDTGSSTTGDPSPCPDPLIDCDSSCIDPDKDEEHCGAADPCARFPGEACDPGEACVDGVCGLSCPAGQEVCFGSCVNAGVSCCGDDACGASENVQTCAIDCVACGDGSCDAPETAASCAADCTTCAHSPCEAGDALAADCDPCIAAVCDDEPACCAAGWDAACVDAVASACGLACPQCGDAQCTWPEDASACAADCTCGDGT